MLIQETYFFVYDVLDTVPEEQRILFDFQEHLGGNCPISIVAYMFNTQSNTKSKFTLSFRRVNVY